MAVAKTKLEFVKYYYEFNPKSLYSDGRSGTDGKAEGAADNKEEGAKAAA